MAEKISLPSGASERYVLLYNVALAFIAAQAQDPTHPMRMNFERLAALLAPDYRHAWGHNYATSLHPHLQGTHPFQFFTKHLEFMLPNLESWNPTITDVLVDEVKRTVMLRVSMRMRIKGSGNVEEREVENDMLWKLEMDGEGKIANSTEFVDGVAAGRIMAIMGEQGNKFG
ncbi:hypothetical protein BKA63DRAFT_572456 [Paraphoma chrysanthemicola]|nr:hypothetical protein BKA63DRAFT_572456 [Paraphoma chrysanthemicola]